MKGVVGWLGFLFFKGVRYGVMEFLAGRVEMGRGGVGEYEELARFHYLGGRPATWAGVWAVRYEGRCVAVGVLSYPTLACRARERVLGLERMERREVWGFVNGNVRTISRVIVHPQFRGVGVASWLVREMCAGAGTRYVEAIAAMGRGHPFFEKGGMVRVPSGVSGKVYYVWGRGGRGKFECRNSNDESMTKSE